MPWIQYFKYHFCIAVSVIYYACGVIKMFKRRRKNVSKMSLLEKILCCRTFQRIIEWLSEADQWRSFCLMHTNNTASLHFIRLITILYDFYFLSFVMFLNILLWGVYCKLECDLKQVWMLVELPLRIVWFYAYKLYFKHYHSLYKLSHFLF